MAKRKKPEFTNIEEEQIWQILDDISNTPPKNEKNIWLRKRKKIEEFVEQVEPIEEKIRELILQKQPIYDEIAKLRNIMVKDCIHPFDLLEYKINHVLCKFCNSKISLPMKN